MEDYSIPEEAGEEITLGELDLEGLEASYAKYVPEPIPPQQVSLLGEAILKSKIVKALGIMVESMKEANGKKKGRGEKRGRHSNVQHIREIGAKLVASGQYPTIVATFSSYAKGF